MTFRFLSKRHLYDRMPLAVLAAGLVWAASASAATVPLGTSGWQASWDASLDPFVNIEVTDETDNSVGIKKIAEFTQGPNAFGLFPPIPIVFEQTSPDAVNRIVITSEEITNSTGVNWTDFHFELFAPQDPAVFNLTAMALDLSPFTGGMFDDLILWVDGGVIPNGGQWLPSPRGSGRGGPIGLVIDVVTGDGDTTPFTMFTLKEEPTPEPATLALLGAGALLLLRTLRRR